MAHDLDVGHIGTVEREHTLDTDTVGHTADGEGLGDTAALFGDDRAFEDLDTLALAFTDLNIHTDGIADLERRDGLLHAVVCDEFQSIHLISS